MRLLTPDCRTPSALAAALKLRYSATTSAWTTETRSIPRDNSRLAKKRFSSSANVMRLSAISSHNLGINCRYLSLARARASEAARGRQSEEQKASSFSPSSLHNGYTHSARSEEHTSELQSLMRITYAD